MFKLPSSLLPVDSTTVLKTGLSLTENVSLDLLTKGVANEEIYPWQTARNVHLFDAPETDSNWARPGSSSLIPQTWKIAANLQHLAFGIVEPLMTLFDTELNIHSAYVSPQLGSPFNDPKSRHFTGEAIDISLDSMEGNMFPIVLELQKMFKNAAVEIGLIFNQRSWLHIGIVGPHSVVGGDPTNPRLFTRDLSNNRSWSGFYPARGLYVHKTVNYRKKSLGRDE